MRATNFASDPALLMSVRFSVAVIGIVLVAADDHVDLGKSLRQRAVVGEGQMRDARR